MSNKSKKILVSGNPDYGLSKSLAQEIEADFVSRTNGYDLTTKEAQEALVEKSFDYDIFINLAALSNFNQTNLLKAVWAAWQAKGHYGQIISIGSTVDRSFKSGDRMYSVEKAALNRLNQQLSLAAHGESKIKVTLISPGMLQTPGMDRKFPGRKKIDPAEVVSIIKWVIDSPEGVNINEISLDPMQEIDK